MLALSSAELTILDWIALHCHTPWLDAVVPWITRLGDGGILWIILALVLLILPKERLVGAQAALALILHVVLCNLLVKNLVGRIRPFELAGIDQLLVALPDDPSFPSGPDRAVPAVSLCSLSHRCAGRCAVGDFLRISGGGALEEAHGPAGNADGEG